MKTLFALAIALSTLATSAHAAIPFTIIEAVVHPGFEMNPKQRTFYVQDDGKMTLEVVSFRENSKKEVIDLGTLSEAAVRGLLAQVNSINPKTKLVDPKKGEPMCTDTPSYETAVFIKGIRKVISSSFGCHSSALESNEGASLVGFASVFLNM